MIAGVIDEAEDMNQGIVLKMLLINLTGIMFGVWMQSAPAGVFMVGFIFSLHAIRE